MTAPRILDVAPERLSIEMPGGAVYSYHVRPGTPAAEMLAEATKYILQELRGDPATYPCRQVVRGTARPASWPASFARCPSCGGNDPYCQACAGIGHVALSATR